MAARVLEPLAWAAAKVAPSERKPQDTVRLAIPMGAVTVRRLSHPLRTSAPSADKGLREEGFECALVGAAVLLVVEVATFQPDNRNDVCKYAMDLRARTSNVGAYVTA